jgi:CRP-like cAMP-binding protein
VTFAPGSKITRQGDEADRFYILVRGSAVAIKREDDADRISADAKARYDETRFARGWFRKTEAAKLDADGERRGGGRRAPAPPAASRRSRLGASGAKKGASEGKGVLDANANSKGKGNEKEKGEKYNHRVLRRYGPGAHFGELALLTNQPRAATVVARERCVALVMDKDALLALRLAVPTLEAHIVRGMRHYDHIEQFTSMAMA